MIAEILTIGDEILRGEIVDSNKAYLAERLLEAEVECHYQLSVRDDPPAMADALQRASERADVVLVSGGLGPTRDDRTTAVVAETFGRELVLDDASLASIRAFFARVGRPMSENNAKQALFPSGAHVLPNPEGTAPGFQLEVPGASVFCLPGVPRELRRMMDEQVLPRLRCGGAGGTEGLLVRARLLRTFGIGESSLDRELEGLELPPGVELGFRTQFPDNLVRVVARASTSAEAEERCDAAVRELNKRLGPLLYGEGEAPLAARVVAELREQQRSFAVAESCTGGLLAERVTAVPGASEVFLGGVSAYANSAKTSLLGVPEALLATYGAVSEEVARAMAEGIRARLGADLALATTGISGPGGGSADKPVGLVYLALASAEETHCDSFIFALDRSRHRSLTAQVGLDWVRRKLLGFELVGPSLMRRGGRETAGTSDSHGRSHERR